MVVKLSQYVNIVLPKATTLLPIVNDRKPEQYVKSKSPSVGLSTSAEVSS